MMGGNLRTLRKSTWIWGGTETKTRNQKYILKYHEKGLFTHTRWFYRRLDKTIFRKSWPDMKRRRITMPTLNRSWRFVTMFNWIHYQERRKPSFILITSLGGNTDHSFSVFGWLKHSFLFHRKTAMESLLPNFVLYLQNPQNFLFLPFH